MFARNQGGAYHTDMKRYFFDKTRPGSVWNYFDSTDVTVQSYEELKRQARQAALAFDFARSGSMTYEDMGLSHHADIPELDHWVTSGRGGMVLTSLVEELHARISHFGRYALPAHDLRQILFKDTAEGLRFAEYEEPQGYKSAFIIPMVAHDIGRLLEGRFYRLNIPHDYWIPHSQLSFLMLRDVLDAYGTSIPERLKNHFLYAVLAHSGENGKTYMARAVQTCDRMQLVGPEGFFRAISYMVGMLPEGKIAYPRDEKYLSDLPNMWDHKSVPSMLEFVGRNMLPNIGERHIQWQNYMMQINTAILHRMTDRCSELRSRIFAPEVREIPETSLGRFKHRFSDDHMARVMDLLPPPSSAKGGQVEATTIYTRLLTILQAPRGAAQLDGVMRSRVLAAIKEMGAEELNGFADAMLFAERKQRELDGEDCALFNRVLAKSSTAGALAQTLARGALPYVPESSAYQARVYDPSHIHQQAMQPG